MAPKAAMLPKRRRPRKACVASASVAAKPWGDLCSRARVKILPDIEHIYMSEKKSNHVKEKYDI